MGNFKLKEGISVTCHSRRTADKKPTVVTNDNLTDDLAEAILREKPHQIRNFEVLPEKYVSKKESALTREKKVAEEEAEQAAVIAGKKKANK